VRCERKRPLGISRGRWADNIKMDLQEMGWGMDSIDLDQDRERLLDCTEGGNELSVTIKRGEFWNG
jgi:hypothetical protein